MLLFNYSNNYTQQGSHKLFPARYLSEKRIILIFTQKFDLELSVRNCSSKPKDVHSLNKYLRTPINNNIYCLQYQSFNLKALCSNFVIPQVSTKI